MLSLRIGATLASAPARPASGSARRRARGWAASYTARSRSVETFVYTCVVEIEAWPSSSCTTRMSAPWSSMWVAHEWRSTCGDSRPAEADPRRRSARTMAHAPWRDSRPPRWLRNTASASPRRAQRGRARARAAAADGASQSASAARRRAAERHDPLLGALAEAPAPAPPSRSRSPSDSPHSSEMRMPVPYSSSRMARSRRCTGVGADDGVEQGADLVLVERLGQAGGHAGRGHVGGRVGGGRALVGEEAVERAHGHERPGHRRRRPALGSEVGDVALDVGLGHGLERRAPRPSATRCSRAGRAGRRPACWPTGPARRPAR